MDFSGSISRLSHQAMPFLAILRHDLRGLRASWLVRLWLAATALLALLVLAGNWTSLPATILIPSLLFPYLVFPWSLIVMVLSVGPVSGARLEAVSDGFLSRPIARYEYLLATWAARVLMVLGVYLVVMVPVTLIAGLAERPVAAEPVTLYGSTAALTVVGLVLTFLVSMGFLFGTLLRNQWLAVVVLAFLWFPVNLILNTFALEEFSPISLTRALPELLQQSWKVEEPQEAEPPPDLGAIAQQAGQLLNLFGSQPAPEPEPRRQFFDPDEFQDFQVSRVLWGYGLPTLFAIALATISFCWRDL